MRLSLLVLLIAGLSLFAATPASAQSPVTVNLAAQNASGVSGTAVLTQVGNDLRVVIDLSGTTAGSSHPVHIHSGACPKPGDVVHGLTAVVDGTSTTLIAGVMLDSVLDGDHAINAHESATNSSNYISCGNIPARAMADATTAPAATAMAEPTAMATAATTQPATLPKTGAPAPQLQWLLLAALAIGIGLVARQRTTARAS